MIVHNPDDDDEGAAPGCYASPPCFMHELDPAYFGLAAQDAQQRHDVARWRKAERERLIGIRLALGADERQFRDRRIIEALDASLGPVAGRSIAVFWPILGDPDLRAWMADIAARGASCLLPAALSHDAPLAFRPWASHSVLHPDAMGIPAPADGPQATPEIIITALVGFDHAGHRLGYGDGLLDRTLAAMAQKPRTIGVGYAETALATIFPQPHDVALDLIVTDSGSIPIRQQ